MVIRSVLLCRDWRIGAYSMESWGRMRSGSEMFLIEDVATAMDVRDGLIFEVRVEVEVMKWI